MRVFADDTSVYIVSETPDASAAVINSDLQKITTLSSWLVTFNPSKTESMIFSRKRDRPIHPPLVMINVPIESVRSHKHIGLTFTDDVEIPYFFHTQQSMATIGNASFS